MTMWGQPPPAVLRSEAPLQLGSNLSNVNELRSTGQPPSAVPT